MTDAAVASPRAVAAGPSVIWTVPFVTMPGGKPVTDDPGLTPRLPCTSVGPVFVTEAAPNTAKVLAVGPSIGGGLVKARAEIGAKSRDSSGISTTIGAQFLSVMNDGSLKGRACHGHFKDRARIRALSCLRRRVACVPA